MSRFWLSPRQYLSDGGEGGPELGDLSWPQSNDESVEWTGIFGVAMVEALVKYNKCACPHTHAEEVFICLV